MRKILLVSFAFAVLAGAWWYFKGRKAGHIPSNEQWVEDFSETFSDPDLSKNWLIPPLTRSVSKIEIKNQTASIENMQYSPYSELWLLKEYEGPVRIEFDAQLNLKPGGEFGVRLAEAQTNVLPNTAGYEIYLASMTTAIIKRSDRDEQINNSIALPPEVMRGEKPVHFIIEKNYRQVWLDLDKKISFAYPDPEILSGKKYDHCGLFLMGGRAIIKNLKVFVYPAGSDLLAQANELYSDGDYAGALDLYEKFLKRDPDNRRALEARFRKALCYRYLENYGESLSILKAIQFNVVDKEYVPDALYFIGEIFQRYKDYDEAIKYYSGFIERFPKHAYVPKAYERIALCHWSLKNYQQVLDATGTLLQQFPTSATAVHSHYLRGQVYEALNDKEKAIREYQTLIQLMQKDLVANMARKQLRHLMSGLDGDRVKIQWKKNAAEIVYRYGDGSPFKSGGELLLHWGRNGWQQVLDNKMEKNSNGWSIEIPLEKDLHSIEFVFTDGQGAWDNNHGLNWEYDVPKKF